MCRIQTAFKFVPVPIADSRAELRRLVKIGSLGGKAEARKSGLCWQSQLPRMPYLRGLQAAQATTILCASKWVAAVTVVFGMGRM